MALMTKSTIMPLPTYLCHVRHIWRHRDLDQSFDRNADAFIFVHKNRLWWKFGKIRSIQDIILTVFGFRTAPASPVSNKKTHQIPRYKYFYKPLNEFQCCHSCRIVADLEHKMCCEHDCHCGDVILEFVPQNVSINRDQVFVARA